MPRKNIFVIVAIGGLVLGIAAYLRLGGSPSGRGVGDPVAPKVETKGEEVPTEPTVCITPTSELTALFSLMGTTYGGTGRTTYALPDLKGTITIRPPASGDKQAAPAQLELPPETINDTTCIPIPQEPPVDAVEWATTYLPTAVWTIEKGGTPKLDVAIEVETGDDTEDPLLAAHFLGVEPADCSGKIVIGTLGTSFSGDYIITRSTQKFELEERTDYHTCIKLSGLPGGTDAKALQPATDKP